MKTRVFAVITCLFGALFSTTPNKINAGSCGVRHVAVCNHHVNEIITPVAIPVIVPAFIYQYQPAIAPIAVTPAYPSIGQPIGVIPQIPVQSQFGDKDKIKELARALLEEMNKQSDYSNGPPTAKWDDESPPASSQPNLGNPTSGKPNFRSRYGPAAMSIMQRNCMSCHTGSGSKKGVIIFSQNNILNTNAPFEKMKIQIEDGHMPPNYSQFKLTAEEKNILSAWFNGN